MRKLAYTAALGAALAVSFIPGTANAFPHTPVCGAWVPVTGLTGVDADACTYDTFPSQPVTFQAFVQVKNSTKNRVTIPSVAVSFVDDKGNKLFTGTCRNLPVPGNSTVRCYAVSQPKSSGFASGTVEGTPNVFTPVTSR